MWSVLSRLSMGAKEPRAQLIHGFGQESLGEQRSLGPARSIARRECLGRGGWPGPGSVTSTWGRLSPGGSAYIHQCRVDVVARFSVHRDEEGQAAVQRQDIHAPVLIMVPRQETDAAVLGPDVGRHDVEGLWVQRRTDRCSSDARPEPRGSDVQSQPPPISILPAGHSGAFPRTDPLLWRFYHLLASLALRTESPFQGL